MTTELLNVHVTFCKLTVVVLYLNPFRIELFRPYFLFWISWHLITEGGEDRNPSAYTFIAMEILNLIFMK